MQWIVLYDKNITSKIKLQVAEKSKVGYLKVENIVNLIASLNMQKIFLKGICK